MQAGLFQGRQVGGFGEDDLSSKTKRLGLQKRANYVPQRPRHVHHSRHGCCHLAILIIP